MRRRWTRQPPPRRRAACLCKGAGEQGQRHLAHAACAGLLCRWSSSGPTLHLRRKLPASRWPAHLNCTCHTQCMSFDPFRPPLCRTYSTLISAGRGRTRLQQLVDWVGGASFEGVICLDECHKGDSKAHRLWEGGAREEGWDAPTGCIGRVSACAPTSTPSHDGLSPTTPTPFPGPTSCRCPCCAAKNFVPGKEKQSTKVSQCVLELQRQLPGARFVYCSATGVSGGCAGKAAWGARHALAPVNPMRAIMCRAAQPSLPAYVESNVRRAGAAEMTVDRLGKWLFHWRQLQLWRDRRPWLPARARCRRGGQPGVHGAAGPLGRGGRLPQLPGLSGLDETARHHIPGDAVDGAQGGWAVRQQRALLQVSLGLPGRHDVSLASSVLWGGARQ